jgi:hypothetical protein
VGLLLELCGEKSTGTSIKCLRLDDGGGFTSLEFGNYARKIGSKGNVL